MAHGCSWGGRATTFCVVVADAHSNQAQSAVAVAVDLFFWELVADMWDILGKSNNLAATDPRQIYICSCKMPPVPSTVGEAVEAG
jgi:hypothetical protein